MADPLPRPAHSRRKTPGQLMKSQLQSYMGRAGGWQVPAEDQTYNQGGTQCSLRRGSCGPIQWKYFCCEHNSSLVLHPLANVCISVDRRDHAAITKSSKLLVNYNNKGLLLPAYNGFCMGSVVYFLSPQSRLKK